MEEREERIRQLQREKFGRRYEGASLSEIRCDGAATKILHKWVQNPVNFLIIMGSPGCGKTYISSAIVDWFYGKVPSMRIWNDQRFLSRLRDFIGSDTRGDFSREIERLLDDELVIIDDLGSSQLTEWQVEVWFTAINFRYESMLPTVITTNLNLNDIKERLGSRTYSRLVCSTNSILDMHSYEDLRQKGF